MYRQKNLNKKLYFDRIGNMKIKDAIKALSALSQENRLKIFLQLVKKGPSSIAAGDLSTNLVMPAATMSFHLKELSNANLIVSRRASRSIIYSANYERMHELINFLTKNCCTQEGDIC